MQAEEVFRWIKAVNIDPILAALDQVQFVPANIGSTNPAKAPCYVPLPGRPLPPAIQQAVEELDLGGETKRILLRKLAPRQGMPPHVDDWMPEELDWHRFQLPLISHPDIKMRWPEDGVEIHLEPGNLYEVRFDRLHEIVNKGDVERIHLQIDQIGATI
jgi:hypothetical protein